MARPNKIQSWLNGDLLRSKGLRRQYPLIGLIAGLIFIYILIGYQSVRQQHRLSDAKQEMMDAKFKYMTINAELTNATRQSNIIEALKAKGSTLKENNKPTIKILN
ncbi:MAG: hypothetical protein IKQ11_00590 [Paludibacteraceae bacterium]|nr:hypothetical protein [Paludibacteraceae bacterium]